MMAPGNRCLTVLSVALLLLISPSTEFELEEGEWERLGADVASLHRLKGLATRFTTSAQEGGANPRFKRETESEGHTEALQQLRTWNKVKVNHSDITSITRIGSNPDACDGFAVCVLKKQEDLNVFLKTVEGTKSHDALLSASEVSYTYRNKLILIVDGEAETLRRAEREYSEDPRYSTKAEISCLSSGTCPLEAGGGTVIKLFGSSSEDGDSLSGFSGSTLASLMLAPALRTASLFSVSGNTSGTFRHDFMRVFKTHDVRAVLETSTQSEHIYHSLQDSGDTVEYRVPKRPADHSTQYDRQHILIMEDDFTVREAAKHLYEKHPTVSSVYMLENQRPKLIKGDAAALTAESRLTLVGHGRKGADGQTRLGGYGAGEVSEIISHVDVEGGQIKTTSVVGCEVGSDPAFGKTLLEELHARSIETELHLRNSLVQVTSTGQKNTGQITAGGLVWRHNDESKKVVVRLDRDSKAVIQTQSDHQGEEIYSDAPDILGHFFHDTWPEEPKPFVDQSVRQLATHIDKIEGLAWAFFNTQKGKDGNKPLNQKLNPTLGEYVYYKIKYIRQNGKIIPDPKQKIVFQYETNPENCYEIRNGEDIRSIITHYALQGEDNPVHFMLNDWIFNVHPKSLYVYLVGRKVKDGEDQMKIKRIINGQRGKETYTDMRQGMNEEKQAYSEYAFQTLKGSYHKSFTKLEAYFGTYFMASVISESARNLRSFPVFLMALDMSRSKDNNIKERGQKILLNELPMTGGYTWTDIKKRGFHGSSAKGGKNKKNVKLIEIVEKEDSICKEWLPKDAVDNNLLSTLYGLVHETQDSDHTKYIDAYGNFMKNIQNQPSTPGALGGSHDGPVTVRDGHSASEVEHSLKLSSYHSRASKILAQHTQTELKRAFGEKLQDLHVNPDSVLVKDGEFHCQLLSRKSPQEVIDWKVKLPAESQHQMEKIGKSMQKISEPPSTHATSEHFERAGKALGAVGLLLGAQAAVHAFEQGDLINGTVATLQTVHGVTGMTLAALGKRVSVAAEGKVTKAIATCLKNPLTKKALVVLPGFGFGIYNIVEDVNRRDTLGYIDAGFDSLIVALDVVELAMPQLAPFSLALNAIRMMFDDIYLDIQAELNKLPPNAGVLDKIGAFFRGFEKGLVHFTLDVASFFYTIPYREIENGQRLVRQISDYHQYYSYTERAGRRAIDFTGGESSWNGGGITFCLSEEGFSELCLDYFVSADESSGKKCWPVETRQTDDIILGTGESHQLQYTEIALKVLLFIPAGSVKVVSGYQELTYSRYGKYGGNSRRNNFFAVQKNPDRHLMEIMLSYFYELHGKAGDDTFYLGPQRSYVEGQGGRDTYIIPEDGGNTNINNYDPLKTTDLLILGVDYDQISASKSVNDVILQYHSDHYVRIVNWFSGEVYRHLNIMSADGIMFDVSTAVFSPVKLTARAVNLMSKSEGQSVDTTEPLLRTVTNILGSAHNDRLIGNEQRNMLDGGGGRDYLRGGAGEDVYIVKKRERSRVLIENYSTDKATDMIIIEANLHSFKTKVTGNDLILMPFMDKRAEVVLMEWFLSEEHRHLLVVTEDLVTFSLSADKTRCSQADPIHSKCIRSQNIDYSRSSRALEVDLEEDEAFQNVTEVRGSNLSDRIKGNSQANTFIPGAGSDYLEGRGGQDLYVVTPGQDTKVILNDSPDLELDTLFLKEAYERIKPKCHGQDFHLWVGNRVEVQIKDWFRSKMSQHLQIRSVDGITFLLPNDSSQCGGQLKLPQSVDRRNEKTAQMMDMSATEFATVVEMYGSSGFDVMRGNDQDNLLDPFTGGGTMTGGEGKDTYVIKPDYGTVEILNFADDQQEDTVQFQVEFLSSHITVQSEISDVIILVHDKGQNVNVTLLHYKSGKRFQHLQFQSADGVHFRVMSPVSNQSQVPQEPWIEAYKVTLKGQRTDCHLDLSSQKNLSTIHTVQGCSYQSNHILANGLDNAVFGGLKDDVLDGGDGHDTLLGGQGNDVLLGGGGSDTLYGEEGDDTLLGGPGSDSFVPGPGADVMDGGSGRDTVLYQGDHETGTGVYINLLSGEGHQADAEGDVLKDVENVIGTIYPDVLVSGYEPALLKGSDGNDVLVSLTDGDTLIGGDGSDIYTMVPHHGWVTIDNCAEDDAPDVLYLPSVTINSATCAETSTGLQLKFHDTDGTFVGISLKNWVNSTHECGHLTLIIKEGIASVETIRQNCKAVGTLMIVETAVIVGLVVAAHVICLALFRKTRRWGKRTTGRSENRRAALEEKREGEEEVEPEDERCDETRRK